MGEFELGLEEVSRMFINRSGGRRAEVEGTLDKGTEKGLEPTVVHRQGRSGREEHSHPRPPPRAHLCPHPAGHASQLLNLYYILAMTMIALKFQLDTFHIVLLPELNL